MNPCNLIATRGGGGVIGHFTARSLHSQIRSVTLPAYPKQIQFYLCHYTAYFYFHDKFCTMALGVVVQYCESDFFNNTNLSEIDMFWA